MESLAAQLQLTWHKLLTAPKGAQWGSAPATIPATSAACAALLLLILATGATMPRKVQQRRGERIEWAMRVVSSVHACVLVFGSVWCMFDAAGYGSLAEHLWGYSWPPDFFARIFLGYLLYDMTVMVTCYRYLKDASGILHHMVFIFVAAYVLAHSIYKYDFTWLALTELSTPFINLRWHLAASGNKDSRLYVANGCAMAAVFFAVRVVGYGYGLTHLWTIRHLLLAPGVPALHRCVAVLMVAGFCLNVYWMAAIAKGVLCAVRRSSKHD